MAQVSQFSTPEFFKQLTDSISQLETAIGELNTAVAAGIPGAEQQLTTAQAALARVEKVKQTYFPSGAAQG